jgi:hypothetical protein
MAGAVVGRALVGILLSGAVLWFVMWPRVIVPKFIQPKRDAATTARLTGTWTRTMTKGILTVTEELSLNGDGTYRDLQTLAAGPVGDHSGAWHVDRNNLILETNAVQVGDPALVGEKGTLGVISQPTEGELVLTSSGGTGRRYKKK